MRLGWSKPVSIQFFSFEIKVIHFLIAQCQEDLFKRADPQVFHAHGTECHVVIFDLVFMGNDPLRYHGTADLFYIGNPFGIAFHQALKHYLQGRQVIFHAGRIFRFQYLKSLQN
ncbi:hypothetical protein FQZ97_911410 [compost metagenome]